MAEFLSLSQIAEQYQISKSTLYKHVAAKKIKHYKPANGKIYFKEEDIIAWIESGEVKCISKYQPILIKHNKKHKQC